MSTSVLLNNYAWLKPAFPSPEPSADWIVASAIDLTFALNSLSPQNISADTETTGLRWWTSGFKMKSIAIFIPSTRELLATSLVDVTPEEMSGLLRALARHNIYAFNLTFDGAVFASQNRQLPKNLRMDEEELLASFRACSQVFFRHCTNEGFNKHSLEVAQENLFGWQDSQKDWLKAALEAKGLTRAEMWRLLEHDDTREGFLYYNAMDARSAWLVWEHLCAEAHRAERPGMISLHEGEFATLIRDCIRQSFVGLPVDRKTMRNILVKSFKKKTAIHTELRNDERIAPWMTEWERKRIADTWTIEVTEMARKMPDSRIVAEALAGYSVEDDMSEGDEAEAAEETKVIRTKDGAPTLTPQGIMVSPSFKVVLKTKKGWGTKFPGFNFGSPDHLKELLYSHLGTAEVAYKKKLGQDEVPRYRITYGDKAFVVGCTDSGEVPTGADIYPIFGDIGKKLEAAAEADTLYGFAKSYLAASSETGKIHTQLKVHGAATGRCTGGSGEGKKKQLSINVQQLPRSEREFMECFKAPKGFVFLSNDFKGLEKVVQAELSGDPVLTRLYASGEKHDVHLYHTMKIHPSADVRAAIAARYALDDAVLSALKKEFKGERSFGKMSSFAFDYGSGAENIQLKAAIEGFPMTLEDAEAARSGYRELYKVYYTWCDEKVKEWEARGGWIEDGFGFPIAIDPARVNYKGIPSSLREAGSKIVQRTGHYILLCWLKHIEAIKRERKLWKLEVPVICDLHDERIVLTPEQRVEECLALHQEALDRTNDELQPKIRFEIASEYGPTLYDCKKG